MRLQEAFYPNRFRLICRTSTSEHERTSGTWRWPASFGVHEIVTIKNDVIKIQFIKFIQIGVQKCGPLNPSMQRLTSRSDFFSRRLASRTCRMIVLPVPRGRQPAAVVRLHPDAGRGSHGRCEAACHGARPADACRDVTSTWTSDS